MAGITKEIAEARLTLYLDAESKVLAGQAVDIDGERLTRADLDAIQKGIEIWNARATKLGSSVGSGFNMREVIPR